MSKQATWFLEQPATTLLHRHPRFRWLKEEVVKAGWGKVSVHDFHEHAKKLPVERRVCGALALALRLCKQEQVHEQRFWMGKHGGDSPKRTVVFSNTAVVKQLDVRSSGNAKLDVAAEVEQTGSKRAGCSSVAALKAGKHLHQQGRQALQEGQIALPQEDHQAIHGQTRTQQMLWHALSQGLSV